MTSGLRLRWAGAWMALAVACCDCALAVDWDALRRGRPALRDGSIDALSPLGRDGASDGMPSDASLGDVAMPDGAPVDGTLPADGGSCSTAAGCYLVPPGWGLAALDVTNTGSCPATFEGSMVVADPVIGPASCEYGPCTVQQQPVCSGSIRLTCLVPQAPVPAGTCEGVTPSSPGSLEFTPVAQGGTCTVAVTATPVTANAQACTNPSAAICDGGACYQVFASPFKACIEAPGSQTCPTGPPFTERHATATSATNVCPTANCSVTTICGGTLTAYVDTICVTSTATVAADGMCHTITGAVGSYEYTLGTPSVACSTAAPPAASVSLVGDRTFCCTP